MKKLIRLVLVTVLILCITGGCGYQINEESYIDVNGVRLAYIEQGTGPALILLHGGGGSSHDLDPMISELSQDYTVYAIDSRGHGNSAPVTEYNYQDMADDVAAFIKEKKLRKPALFGFSDGGIVGLLVAYQRPNSLSKLIVSGANADPSGIRDEDRSAMEQSYATTQDAELKMELEQPDITKADLEKIRIPVLVTAGSDDMIKEEHTELIARSIPNSKLEILEGESHTSYVLESDKLVEMIKAFLLKS